MKKTNKKDRRILTAALVVAGVTVAGSTFAWFTSKDEVTNRLSASADYNVSIAEDFQPPEDWVPGQTINKDVSAVNTGSVDAFVRMWLEGEMSVLGRDDTGTLASAFPTLTKTTDESYKNLGLNFYDATTGKYYRELSTVQRNNPQLNGNQNDENDNAPAGFSEVQSMQAGGVLVYAPDNASYSWELEQATEMTTYANDTDTTGAVSVLSKGTVVGTYNSQVANKVTPKNVNYYGAIDASTFTPLTEGLYIFRRNVELSTTENEKDTYEYSGYYFYLDINGGRHYLALNTDTSGNSDYTLPATMIDDSATANPSGDVVLPVDVTNVELFTASETVLTNSELTWTYDSTTPKLTASYGGADGTLGDDTTTADVDESLDDIVIDVMLDNIGDTDQTWTAKTATGKTTTFYYNDDVEAGDTTTKLVDSVKLADSTTQYAFLAFDFDLNVFLESVQVTIGENGNEKTTPVEAGGQFATAPTGGVGAHAAAQDTSEIADIAWTAD